MLFIDARLLAVGRVDDASSDIVRALQLSPADANALALQTIINVVKGAKNDALDSAQQAVQVAPASATAQIALSYALQARFDLEGARASLQRAVELDPQNALAWARLSELWASFGELDHALAAAHRAAALEPNLSRTQTVLGYAHLMQAKTKAAEAAFEKAIELDSADPLPRLGLGLAKIREGHLNPGSREIETAASLDPNNAIVRSYLGKAYYEKKQRGLDEREYAVAKQLDPNDPTPYFYDGIAKQTTNRPVEALNDLQRAIELNDNRAIYRSRLLLDADEAARSAAQGRVYSDLGFQQLALVEGWKSVNTDPSNFSAHRLLADSYAILPRHGIARVSELLQAQLLQPLNRTPIQPRLAESDLALISAGGPGGLSFNEFNPIFNRDGVTLQATGLGGENSTWAGEGVLAGIYKNVSFSLGYTHFDTNGWRPNAEQQDRIANAFVQLALSPSTSIQAEYRYRNRKTGDIALTFFDDQDFRRNFGNETRTHTARIGARHNFSPASILLGSFIYQRRDSTDRDSVPAFGLDLIEFDVPNQDAFSGELQHLFRSRWVDTVTGVGFFHVDAQEKDTIVLDPTFGIPPITSSQDLSSRHVNVYLYAHVKPLSTLTLTLGASGDVFNTESSTAEDTTQFNPKLGVVWNPLPATTVRAAVVRTLTRPLITDQTLEPTQVAGFNQFYSGINATKAWRYGVAVDQKFTRDLFGGAEFTYRDVSIPVQTFDVNTGSLGIERGDGEEYLARAYFFWTPHPWVALSAEYQYERFTRESLVAFPFSDVTTHRVPLGLRLFHPTGVSLALKGTYFSQDGAFFRQGTADHDSGDSDFWVLDAGLSYRLPQRFGLVTIGVTNLLNKRFRYQDTDFLDSGSQDPALRSGSIQPDRFVFAKLSLAF
jgi:tetratricopeptide (TPR) repeat protein